MRLIDVELRAKCAPKTFHLPPRKARHGLRVGDFAKLIFADRERMWVRVTETARASGVTAYVGRLDNRPVVVRGVKLGDLVSFGPEHVSDLLRGGEA